MAPVTPPPGVELPAKFGDIDIYLFDQLLRGRFDRRPRVLDAGCGDGRNLIYFLRRGFTCFGIDRDAAAIEHVRALAAQLAPDLPLENFRAGEIARCRGRRRSMDAVVCSAVLHFAPDLAHFDRWSRRCGACSRRTGCCSRGSRRTSAWRTRSAPPGAGSRLPDGSDRFVVDEAMLLERTAAAGRSAARSDQDHQRAAAALHDDVGGSKDLTFVVRGPRRQSPSSSPTPLKSST